MTIWIGAPTASTSRIHSISQWADNRSVGWVDANGDPVVWWEAPTPDMLGVQYPPGWCFGSHCRDMETECTSCADLGCDECDPDGCFHDMPDWLDAKPFWVELGLNHCPTPPVNANAVYQRLVAQVEATGWRQVARRYATMLQDTATDLTGATVSTLSEGVGTLLKARGTLGLDWGGLVVPGYALPAFAQRSLLETRGGAVYLTGTDVPIFADPGIPTTGPGGTPAGAGASYIYIVGRAPTVAFHDEITPGGSTWDFNNPASRPMFYDDACACGGCFKPLVRRRAIVAPDGCGVFAVAVDVRDCACPDALPAPGGE